MATRNRVDCSSSLSAMSIPALLLAFFLLVRSPHPISASKSADSLTYLWPLPSQFTSGDYTLSVDPALSLSVAGNGGSSRIVKDGFDRYKAIIFKNTETFSIFNAFRKKRAGYDIAKLKIIDLQCVQC
ncbi:hypothetical protein CDL15_Pgr025939 [Punica granatum]|uniref:Uncharacterized protein n=1 Tax=Punica granatum TaxID=22663 RepID=A0A218WC59_PUNGR|nr:hypothetical protein CDL15_Pgr025939 [Punica granatum]